MKKNNVLNKLVSVSTLALMAAAVSGVAKAEDCKSEIKTINPGVLTVTSVVLPPFAYKSPQGEFMGIDAEVVKAFAQKNCLKVNHLVTDSAAAIQYVVASRADLSVGAWYRTAARAKVLGVTDPVYLEQTALYTRTGSDKFSDLDGKKVGTVQGYLWVDELKGMYGDKLSLYPNAVALAQDISTGRIDAAVNTYAIGVEAQRQGGLAKDIQIKVSAPDERVKSSIYPAQTAYLFSQKNEELGKALNATIKDLKDSGQMAKIMTQYHLESSAADTGTPRYADQ